MIGRIGRDNKTKREKERICPTRFNFAYSFKKIIFFADSHSMLRKNYMKSFQLENSYMIFINNWQFPTRPTKKLDINMINNNELSKNYYFSSNY